MIAKKYIGRFGFGYFLFDFLSCFPVLTYELLNGFDTELGGKTN